MHSSNPATSKSSGGRVVTGGFIVTSMEAEEVGRKFVMMLSSRYVEWMMCFNADGPGSTIMIF
jgi:hypothetical protein